MGTTGPKDTPTRPAEAPDTPKLPGRRTGNSPSPADSGQRLKELRKRAEAAFSGFNNTPAEYQGMVTKLLEELSVYQIELEIQNEELRNANTVLEQSRRRQRTLFLEAPVSYLVLSDRFIIREINRRAVETIGLSAENLIGQRFLSFIPQQGLFKCHQALKNLQTGGAPGQVETVLRISNDNNLHVLLNISLLTALEEGAPENILIGITDIEDKVQKQHILQNEREQLALLAEDRHQQLEETVERLQREMAETERLNNELSTHRSRLEETVKIRTAELEESNDHLNRTVEKYRRAITNLNAKEATLQERNRSIEKTNSALQVLLEVREKDRALIEEQVVANLRVLATPHLDHLRVADLPERLQDSVCHLDDILERICSPLVRKLNSPQFNLTPTELQIAHQIRHGRTTKDISVALSISTATVEVHRRNIRRKCKLSKSGRNLRSFLASLD